MAKKKMFNIVAEFELIKKPDWLDDFRKKYDKPYYYHITLKNSTYFNEDEFEKIKKALKEISLSYNVIRVIFNSLFISQTSKGWCIMIRAEKNQALIRLQKNISNEFSKYGEHISWEHKQFENNFDPHITIARHLTPEQLNSAKDEIKKNVQSEAKIKKIALTVANDDIFEDWSNINNKSFFSLSNE